jgi:hypothetical protein
MFNPHHEGSGLYNQLKNIKLGPKSTKKSTMSVKTIKFYSPTCNIKNGVALKKYLSPANYTAFKLTPLL